eukprot:515953-Hanusia_phi.AAC.1
MGDISLARLRLGARQRPISGVLLWTPGGRMGYPAMSRTQNPTGSQSQKGSPRMPSKAPQKCRSREQEAVMHGESRRRRQPRQRIPSMTNFTPEHCTQPKG